MRAALVVGSPFMIAMVALIACLGVATACSDSSNGSSSGGPGENESGADAASLPGNDAAEDTSTLGDAGKDAGEPLSVATEVEPNNGQPATAIGTMTLPGTMNGKIDPANDVDIFAIDLAPGEFWEWAALPTTADLAPLITIFDLAPGNLNPTAIGYSGPGAPAKLQHFVLRPGTFVAAMRDARNRAPSQNKGGPTYGYALTGKRTVPQAIPVTFPATKTGKLASVGAVDLYTFTGTGGKGFDIVVNAKRKLPASTLDSRLSLFDIPAKQAIITNDNVSAAISDSQVGSPDPFPSTYMVIVENEGTNDADLSYEIQFKLRP